VGESHILGALPMPREGAFSVRSGGGVAPASCDVCGGAIPPRRRRRRALRCSHSCSRAAERRRLSGLWRAPDAVPPERRAALSELAVVGDLLRRGWAVYRSVGAAGPCTLVAEKAGEFVKVRVRTGCLTRDGKVRCPGLRGEGTVAVVVPKYADRVVYTGPATLAIRASPNSSHGA